MKSIKRELNNKQKEFLINQIEEAKYKPQTYKQFGIIAYTLEYQIPLGIWESELLDSIAMLRCKNEKPSPDNVASEKQAILNECWNYAFFEIPSEEYIARFNNALPYEDERGKAMLGTGGDGHIDGYYLGHSFDSKSTRQPNNLQNISNKVMPKEYAGYYIFNKNVVDKDKGLYRTFILGYADGKTVKDNCFPNDFGDFKVSPDELFQSGILETNMFKLKVLLPPKEDNTTS
jgi:hypothetical protein